MNVLWAFESESVRKRVSRDETTRPTHWTSYYDKMLFYSRLILNSNLIFDYKQQILNVNLYLKVKE